MQNKAQCMALAATLNMDLTLQFVMCAPNTCRSPTRYPKMRAQHQAKALAGQKGTTFSKSNCVQSVSPLELFLIGGNNELDSIWRRNNRFRKILPSSSV